MGVDRTPGGLRRKPEPGRAGLSRGGANGRAAGPGGVALKEGTLGTKQPTFIGVGYSCMFVSGGVRTLLTITM